MTDSELADTIAMQEADIHDFQDAVGEATRFLGHEGRGPDDLRDAVGQLERLLDGHDVDCKGFSGAAAQVQRLIQFARVGGFVLTRMTGQPGVSEVLSEGLTAHLNTSVTADDVYALMTGTASREDAAPWIESLLAFFDDLFDQIDRDHNSDH